MSDDPGDDAADVVRLFPDGDELDDDRPLRMAPPPEGFCSHRPLKVELDRKVRRVYCGRCGEEMPTFDVLLDLTRGWERYIAGRKEAERRCRVVEANLAELLRLERNAKGRARRRA